MASMAFELATNLFSSMEIIASLCKNILYFLVPGGWPNVLDISFAVVADPSSNSLRSKAELTVPSGPAASRPNAPAPAAGIECGSPHVTRDSKPSQHLTHSSPAPRAVGQLRLRGATGGGCPRHRGPRGPHRARPPPQTHPLGVMLGWQSSERKRATERGGGGGEGCHRQGCPSSPLSAEDSKSEGSENALNNLESLSITKIHNISQLSRNQLPSTPCFSSLRGVDFFLLLLARSSLHQHRCWIDR